MKNKYFLFLLSFLLISNVCALDVYAGETINVTNDLGIDDLSYTLSNNITPVDLGINLTNESIVIYFPSDMVIQSFDIVFFEPTIKEVTQTVRVGGSRRTVTEYVNQTVLEVIEVVKGEDECDVCNDTILGYEDTQINEIKPYWGLGFVYWITLIIFLLILILISKFDNIRELFSKLKKKKYETYQPQNSEEN